MATLRIDRNTDLGRIATQKVFTNGLPCCAIYSRVSTTMQVSESSLLENQEKAALANLDKKFGAHLYNAVLIRETGHSDTDGYKEQDDRSGLTLVKVLAARKLIQFLVINDTSCLTRDLREYLELMTLFLEPNGISLIVVQPQVP